MALTYLQERRMRGSIINLFDNTERFHWHSEAINRELGKLRQSKEWKKATIRQQYFFEGMIEARRNLIDRSTAHVYLCNDGKYRATSSLGYQTYKYPSEKGGKVLIDDTCILVWKDQPDKVYFASTDTMATLEACKAKYSRDDWTMTLDSFDWTKQTK